MGELLKNRRQQTKARIEEFRAQLADAERLCASVACVYMTGSFSREEASLFSDLDLFIVGDSCATGNKRALSNLDEIIIKADLIEATRALNLPPFSGDGEYLAHYTVEQLVDSLGRPDDDVKNTFTARLLLLLESAPLVGAAAYHKFTNNVVSAYWRDYEDRKNDFMPAFLANDILRMWRTFCVNYEARTRTEPDRDKAKRKLKNYKLKHSRLLTCYSALLYLAAVYRRSNTVHPDDVVHMISLTPTRRIEWMLEQPYIANAHDKFQQVLELYERFLDSTNASEEELIERFLDRDKSRQYSKSAYEFGNVIFDLLELVGSRNLFHRLLVV